MDFLIVFIPSIAIMIYLIIDAPKHNKSPVLWGILGFILGFLGLGIYLIATNRKVLGWIIIVVSILLVIIVVVFILFFFYSMFSYF